jgi:hypothetical protein
MDKTIRPPVIIIGMHRSGTSMITRILEELGLFVGWRKDPNHEALLFQKLNDWLMRQASATWDNPKAFKNLLEHQDVRALTVDYISHLMKTPRVLSYLGWGKYLGYRTPFTLDIPWGWKDPRNTFTLPIWLDIFPEAKVIHVLRNGVDVANSLRTRQEEVLSRSMANYRLREPFFWVWPKRDGFTDTIRCASLQGGFLLWEEYISEARDRVCQLGMRAFEIKYEAFVNDPVAALKTLCLFTELAVEEETIQRAVVQVRKDRSNAHVKDCSLHDFAQEVNERLRKFGY